MQEVKGQIKLRFRSTDGKPVVCSRSFNLTQRQKKKEYKALESVLQTLDAAGQRTTMSTKCSDLNKLVPQLMGVSHAILENVVFCHQEDSNWCLGDDATLKRKFDEIFASARYTKALEELKKAKNEKTAALRQLKAEQETAEVRLKQYEGLNNAQEKDRKAVEEHEAEIASREQQLEVLNASIAVLERKAAATEKASAELAALKVQAAERKKNMQETREEIHAQYQRELDQTDEDLKTALDKAASDQSRRREDERAARILLDEAQSKRRAAEKGFEQVRERLSQLRAEAQVAVRSVRARDEGLVKAAVALELAEPGPLPLGAGAVAAAEQRLRAAVQEREASHGAMVRAHAEELDALALSVEDKSVVAANLRTEQMRLEKEVARRADLLKASQSRVDNTMSQMTQTGASPSAAAAVSEVDRLRAELAAAQEDVEAARTERDEAVRKRRAEAHASRRRKFQRDHDALVEELEEAHRAAGTVHKATDAIAAHDKKKRELDAAVAARQADLARLINGRDPVRALLDNSLVRAARGAVTSAKEDADDAEKAATTKERAHQALEQQLAADDKAARAKDREASNAESRLRTISGDLVDVDDIDALMSTISAEIMDGQKALTEIEFMPKYVEKAVGILEKKSACHLCRRKVVAEDLDTVRQAMEAHSSRGASHARDLAAQNEVRMRRLDEIKEAAPFWRKLKAGHAEAEALRSGRQAKAAAASKAKEEADADRQTLAEARAAEKAAENARSVVEHQLQPLAQEVARLQAEVDATAAVSAVGGQRDQEVVMAEMRKAKEDKDAVDKADAAERTAVDAAEAKFHSAVARQHDVERRLRDLERCTAARFAGRAARGGGGSRRLT